MIGIRRLIWDTWNVPHVARHDVLPEEVEQVCHGNPHIVRTYGGRFLITDPAETGRMLAVVLAPEPSEGEQVYYPVTARSADRKERRIYQERQGGAKG